MSKLKFSSRLYTVGTELQHATRQMNWCLCIVKGARVSIRHYSYVMGRLARTSALPYQLRTKCHEVSTIMYAVSNELERSEFAIREIVCKPYSDPNKGEQS